MKYLLSIAILFASFNSFCQSKIKNDTLYKSVSLTKDDAGFLVLKAKAQNRIDEFIEAVNKYGKDVGNYRLVVKSDFVENDEHEHMWSQIVMYNNGVFAGVFIDSPFKLKKIKTGQKVSVKKSDIEDWIIYNSKNEKIAGYFSEEYLKAKE